MFTRKLLVTLLISSSIAAVAFAQGGKWTAAEVKNASGKEGCQQLTALPKRLKKKWKLGFINPNKGRTPRNSTVQISSRLTRAATKPKSRTCSRPCLPQSRTSLGTAATARRFMKASRLACKN
jgi:hypothetical protein